jgi:hypothetical protein
MNALYDYVAPGEEALVMATIMEMLSAGRLVFSSPVLAQKCDDVCS